MKISVALCTYNGEKYLRQQLLSIANQSQKPDELIVVDDLSQDTTWTILEEFSVAAPFSVKLFQNTNNVGAIRNFETALALCDGDIVFLSDQDDLWRQDKVETVAKVFALRPGTAMVFSDAAVVDDKLESLPGGLWQHMGLVGGSLSSFESDPFVFLLTDHNVVTGATAAFSKRAVQRALPFPDVLAIFHDGWLALLASALGPVTACPEHLIQYRQHGAQQLGVRQLAPNFGLSDYERHYRQLIDLRLRIGDDISPYQRKLVDEFVQHLAVRTNLTTSPIGRSLQVFQEILSGRYGRFSSGIKSAAKDILRN